MDFIISSKKSDAFENSIEISEDLFFSYILNNSISDKELILQYNNFIVVADGNLSFINKIKNIKEPKDIEANIYSLTNGFAINIERNNQSIQIFTDIFGFYPLYYLCKGNDFFITTDFKSLLRFSLLKTDFFAFLDILNFNYPLFDRTIIADIKRFKGGSKVCIKNKKFSIQLNNNFADQFPLFEETNNNFIEKLGELLNSKIQSEISSHNKNILTITGGYDSRTLLASLCFQKLEINAISFGQKGNIEFETIDPFIQNFVNTHQYIELNENYISNLNSYVEEYISSNLGCPIILDLPHYAYLNAYTTNSNLLVGFMGGEIISGQSIGAQITFTKTAAILLNSNKVILKEQILKNLSEIEILDHSQISASMDDYIDSLSAYFFEKDKRNILRFLINEKYSKFFGTVNSNFRNKCNLVVPFMDKKIIETILHSKIGFLNKPSFRNNPFDNFNSKKTHSKLIYYLCPELGKTKTDRLYKIIDLCYPYRYPYAIAGYLNSHIFKKNKKNYPKPHHYAKWLYPIIKNELNDLSDISCFLKKPVTNNYIYSTSENLANKTLINLMSVKKALRKINLYSTK